MSKYRAIVLILLAVAFALVACATASEMPLPATEAGTTLPSDMLSDAGPEAEAPLCPSNACPAFHLDCNTDAGDGCEVNVRTDLDNCGGCGNRCDDGGAPPPYTRPACLDGKCAFLCTDDLPFGPMRNCIVSRASRRSSS